MNYIKYFFLLTICLISFSANSKENCDELKNRVDRLEKQINELHKEIRDMLKEGLKEYKRCLEFKKISNEILDDLNTCRENNKERKYVCFRLNEKYKRSYINCRHRGFVDDYELTIIEKELDKIEPKFKGMSRRYKNFCDSEKK